MRSLLLISILVLSVVSAGLCQTGHEIVVPPFNDTYTQSVKQLELGNTDIDYKNFRESFIESEQFKVAAKQRSRFDSLKNQMYALMKQKEYEAIINVTKQMLSIDYTSMMAHKILRQTFAIVGDTINATKYKTIQFGLLNSIVKNGDGKTCASAWPVIQLSEEYFILQMLGASVERQSIDNTNGICDKMEVKTEEGAKATYYFETTKIFEGYKKLGLH